MAKNYYAVKKGYAPGIYKTWDECKKQILGFSGAEYKGFESREQAESFMYGEKNLEKKKFSKGSSSQQKTADTATKPKHLCEAYVDGSYNSATCVYGYGVILIYGNEEYRFIGHDNDRSMASMRNVAGEINGCMRAIDEVLALKREQFPEIDTISIYYDYFGIEKWATGEWRANKKGTRQYVDFINEKRKDINIIFQKVRGHSGDRMNDAADVLAKKAVGIL